MTKRRKFVIKQDSESVQVEANVYGMFDKSANICKGLEKCHVDLEAPFVQTSDECFLAPWQTDRAATYTLHYNRLY